MSDSNSNPNSLPDRSKGNTNTNPNSSQSKMASRQISKTTREALAKAKQMIPPLSPHFHKGQQGRIAVLGGSEDYTGAPYFSAMASARLGADLSHVICEPQAAQVIKSYSPNLMVHPLMRQSSHAKEGETAENVAKPIVEMLPRLHVLVIGPGLGRDKLMQDTVAEVLKAARRADPPVPVVLDADGLLLAVERPELVKGWEEVILTPNVVEFGRLMKSQGLDAKEFGDGGDAAAALAKKLGGVTILQKGGKDWISNGEVTTSCDLEGGYKRSGGQGDTLTGSIATFLGWRKAYLDKLWDHDGSLTRMELLALAAFGGAAVTRVSALRV
jgi:ATP-dependent NAD(P)H-hydrate dehydratase